jgi:predicted Ser/Thr protein kinase
MPRRWSQVASIAGNLVLPPEDDSWLPGFKPAPVLRARVTLSIVWMIGNFLLLVQMLGNPDLDHRLAIVSVAVMNGFLALDVIFSLAFLRRWWRGYGFFFGVAMTCELGVFLWWIYMTGSATSYYVSAVAVGVFVARAMSTYRISLAIMVIALVVQATVFVLEKKGILPNAPLVHGAGARGLYIPPGFRDMAAASMAMSYPFSFLSANLLSKVVRRQLAALEQVKNELRRAVDQARVGRLSGTRLGEYSIDDLLGRGGMGEVYAARRVKGGQEVALKLLHAHLGSDDKMRARFRREAEVVSKMPVGTVAAVYQFGTTEEGYDYIVMERLRGEDLGALLRRRERLEPEEVLTMAQRVAVGLDAAHAAGVVHRDLKPQNVFLVGPDDIRLLDFGIARLHEAVHAMTATAAVLGTPGYMPPEQAAGGEVGPAADVFALGAIVYRGLTGKPAFPSRSPAGALYEALHHDPPPVSELVPGLPRDVDAVLTLALAKDPQARYQRASELAEDLDAALRGRLPDATRARAAALRRAAPATMTATSDIDPRRYRTS